MGTVLVARGEKVLFSKGYGSANLEWNVPNTPAGKFRLGSITKQFTSASILLLEERGKLSVNDPVSKYFPNAPATWDKITLFNLLTHTSGIPDYTNQPEYRKLQTLPTTAEQIVLRVKDKPLDFEPGEKYKYDNTGYVLLGYIIEKITGESYAKFLQDNLFTPAGMADSGYDSPVSIIPNRASGYVMNAKDQFENAAYLDMTVPHAAGALYSTTGDLLKWEQALFGGKILKPESLVKMTTPFKNNYAFGLIVRTADGRKSIEHGGGIDGFNTDLTYYPDDKLTVVVLRNVNLRTSPGEIAHKLAAACFGEPSTTTAEYPKAKDVNSIDGIIAALYDVISGPAAQKREWDRFRALFVPGARLVATVKQPTGEFGPRTWDPEGYSAAVGPNLEKNGFFEREVSRKIENFGDIAQVFSTYESRHTAGDAKPFARGINSIQLMNDGKRWWIVTVFWQAESPDHQIPPQFLPKP
jgi:CubicO group peptidase (beta-lactamase class C family)